MVLQCMTWIPRVLGQLVDPFKVHKKGVVRPLPEDVIINILSRLPADIVLRCRRVCRLWQTLTSTPYFAELHLKRVTSELFVQCVITNDLELLIFDGAKMDTRISKIRVSSANIMKDQWPMLVGSCNGLLLFESFVLPLLFFILNPVTQQRITCTAPANPGRVCGFFFHPVAREYMLLYVHKRLTDYQYFVSTLGSKIWGRLTSLPYRPVYAVPSAIVNRSLHWMAEQKCTSEFDIASCKHAILVFSMDSKDFRAMPHPGNECHSGEWHEMMHLLEMKEHSSLCYLFMYGKQIDVWMLEDYANWAWARRYKVNLDWDVKRYPFKFGGDGYKIKTLCIHNGELLLAWFMRGLFWYHLELKTVRKIKWAGTKIDDYLHYWCRTIAYTKSLVTLRDIPTAV